MALISGVCDHVHLGGRSQHGAVHLVQLRRAIHQDEIVFAAQKLKRAGHIVRVHGARSFAYVGRRENIHAACVGS